MVRSSKTSMVESSYSPAIYAFDSQLSVKHVESSTFMSFMHWRVHEFFGDL